MKNMQKYTKKMEEKIQKIMKNVNKMQTSSYEKMKNQLIKVIM